MRTAARQQVGLKMSLANTTPSGKVRPLYSSESRAKRVHTTALRFGKGTGAPRMREKGP